MKQTSRAKALKGSTLASHSQSFVDAANAEIGHLIQLYQREGRGHPDWDTFFNALAVQLSKQNVKDGNGGPFGALIVAYEGGLDKNGIGIGRPVVKGVGANHVFPASDPSAHAEMEAYRDFARRTGTSDMRGMTLYTSCECCPMCLGVANGAGISRISYVNTRQQAADIGFTDKAQYDLLARPDLFEQMTDANTLLPRERDDLVKKLGRHDAMVLDEDGNPIAYGDCSTRTDPTRLASIEAIRAACRNKQSFELPEGYSLVTRRIPAMSGLVTADWAKILRKRDPDAPFDPERDAKTITRDKLIYLESEFEQIEVKDASGKITIPQDALLTYQQPALPDAQRAIPTQKFSDGGLASTSRAYVKMDWETSGGEPTLNPLGPEDTSIATGSAQRVFEMFYAAINQNRAGRY